MNLEWCWKSFDELSGAQIHDIFKIRQAVFVIEQNCLYQDLDGLDIDARHLFVYLEDEIGQRKIAAYLRLIPPGLKDKDLHIGRVLVASEFRGLGLAKRLMMMGIDKANSTFVGQDIRISAQKYLQKFYQALGFDILGLPYDEDGIEHIGMIKQEK